MELNDGGRHGHVLNLLARLREGPPPLAVQTKLIVTTPPLADLQCYDHLRLKVGHE